MKVLIAGSNHHSNSDEFQKICFQIGQELSRLSHHLILGSDNPKTADFHVFQGYNSTKLISNKAFVIRPADKKETPFHEFRKDLNIVYLRKGRNWASGRTHQVLASDVVLTISGGRGTENIISTAMALGKPVLPVPSGKGISETVWNELDKSSKGVFKVLNNVSILEEKWIETNAKIIAEFVQPLYKKNPFRISRFDLSELFLLLACILGILIWLFLFSTMVDVGISKIFQLSSASVLMGVILRNGIKRLNEDGFYLSLRIVLVELVVGVLTAIGLLFFYISGGLVIEGGFEFLQKTDLNSIYRIGISVSIIGLGSGYLIEKYSGKLGDLLRNQIEE
ncbi:MAG: hypothetical protein R8G66_01160 [Cytophagales bacterium]|nr:hypothetical protein [Cytophagales bacterium]